MLYWKFVIMNIDVYVIIHTSVHDFFLKSQFCQQLIFINGHHLRVTMCIIIWTKYMLLGHHVSMSWTKISSSQLFTNNKNMIISQKCKTICLYLPIRHCSLMSESIVAKILDCSTVIWTAIKMITIQSQWIADRFEN